MSKHTRYAFVTLAVSLLSTLLGAGCAATSPSYVAEPRNLAGTAHTPHVEPLRVRESTVTVERASVSSGHSLGMARRARAR